MVVDTDEGPAYGNAHRGRDSRTGRRGFHAVYIPLDPSKDPIENPTLYQLTRRGGQHGIERAVAERERLRVALAQRDWHSKVCRAAPRERQHLGGEVKSYQSDLQWIQGRFRPVPMATSSVVPVALEHAQVRCSVP